MARPSGREIDAYYPKSVFCRRFPGFGEAAVGLEENRERLIAAVEAYSASELHGALAPGKWSPAEVVDHLILANQLFCRALGPIEDGSDLLVMPRGRLGEEGKALAPPEVGPRAGRSGDDLVMELGASTSALVRQGDRLRESGKLEAPCIVHAFFGELTGVECLQLQAWHMGWHLRQLMRPAN